MNVIRVGIGAARAQLVGDAADGEQVARLEQRERLGVVDPLAGERLVEDRAAVVARHDDRSGGDEAQLGHLVELADVVRELEERVEPGALARPEAVAELLEVAREEAGRVAVALGGLVGERLGLGARGADRCDERLLELEQARDAAARARPRRRTPSAGRCARATAGRDRGAASDPRTRTCSAASPISSFASASSPSGTCAASGSSTFVSTTDVADSGVTATVRIRSSGSFETSWIESTAPSRRDAEPRQQEQRVGVARVLDRRDRRRVDLARDQPPVELGRDAGDLLVLGVDPEEDRRHVRVGDAAEADHAAPVRRSPRCFGDPPPAPDAVEAIAKCAACPFDRRAGTRPTASSL